MVRVARVEEIRPPAYEPAEDEADWHPVRAHFGIGSFGINAFVATAPGRPVVGEHTEVDESGTRHEELYFVAAGRARFVVDGEEVDAPAGTFVYVPDPDATRGATAEEPGTTVLCIGGEPGVAFAVSPWEQKYADGGA